MYVADAPDGKFPDLHDVPDVPLLSPTTSSEATKADMEAQYEEMQNK